MLTQTLPNLALSLLDLRDSSCIAIADLSVYGVVPGPSQRSLKITVPGQTVGVSVTNFTPGNVNVYKCNDLQLTCSSSACTPLPDGIYSVEYTVSNVTTSVSSGGTTVPAYPTLKQKFIKIDTIKCKYQHAFLKVDLECGCHDKNYYNYMNELRQIKIYIDGSVAECNAGNYRLSYEYYTKADKMLDKLSCKFPNSNWKQCCN